MKLKIILFLADHFNFSQESQLVSNIVAAGNIKLIILVNFWQFFQLLIDIRRLIRLGYKTHFEFLKINKFWSPTIDLVI